MQKEFAVVSALVEKGLAVASRKTDLEHAMAGFRTERLDQVTAVMRARQGIPRRRATSRVSGTGNRPASQPKC